MEFPKILKTHDFHVWVKEVQLAGYEIKRTATREWAIAESRGWVEGVYERMAVLAVYRSLGDGAYHLNDRPVRGMSRSIFEKLGPHGRKLDYL